MKKILSFLLMLVLTLSSFLVYVEKISAKEEDSTYVVLELSIPSGSDAKDIIQKALDTNRYDSSKPLKIIVPAGSYTLSEHLVLYSNTYLECSGAAFKKDYKTGTMLRIGLNSDEPTGYSFYHDITINGGVFDADGKSGKKTGSILNFSHVENIIISNTTFKNCCNAHHIGFAGCKDVTITNCSFEGHFSSANNSFNREAIQLDILEEYHFPDLAEASYDGTMNKNITITGCTFNKVDRGVGSHSAYSGKYMDNITITNNVFKNVTGYAVITSCYRNVTITNNKITQCGSGIYYRSINPGYSNYYKFGNTPKVDKGTIISNNTINIIDTKDKNINQSPYGIRVYGENVKKNTKIDGGILKAGDHRARNLTIKNNKITIKRCANGIWIEGGVNNNLVNNTIDYTKNYKTKEVCYGIRLVQSNHITVHKNVLNGNNIPYVENGILAKQSKDIKISSNKISKTASNGIYLTQGSNADITNCTVSSNKGNGIYFTNKAKGSVKNTKLQKNKLYGIYITKAAGKVTLGKNSFQNNKAGKIAK